MTFVDEAHYSRWFNCGWRPRREDADAIAQRIQRMASALRAVDEKLSRLWPQFEMRAMRATDPGPVLELSTSDLGRLIDRRARFDPPQLPAPCGPTGYSVVLVGNVLPRHPGQEIGFSVRAGSSDAGFPNSVDLVLDDANEVWRDAGAGVKVLDAMREAWDVDWAFSGGTVFDRTPERLMSLRPWLRWVRDRQAMRAVLVSQTQDLPGGETTRHGEGELSLWR